MNESNVVDDVDTIDTNPDEGNLMLTTIDNPFNPKTDYDKWRAWDEENGYNTESFVARLIVMDEDFDLNDELGLDSILNKVLNEILEHDVLNIYILV